MVRNLVAHYIEMPWEALKYIIGNVIYGGRITDEWDIRVLLSSLKKFLGEGLNETGVKYAGF